MQKLRGQAGMSMIEALVAVMVLGLAFVAIVAGISSAIIASSQHRRHTEATTVLTSYAEAVKAATFVPCATAASQYGPASVGYTVPAGYTAQVFSIEYWHKATNTFDGTCAATPPDVDVQRITLRASATTDLTAGTLSETLTLIKRKP